ncbi:SLC13 family permease [Streptomyces olivaceoviridis]|uniref:SLC13 family permease n=1 Tax=Streptomyces olivaceoviridis TaxID=1921 RepID=UPI003673F689
MLVVITAVASALHDNATTVLLIAPVMLLVRERLDLFAATFLIAVVRASDIDGTATLVGDRTNIHRRPGRPRFRRLLGPLGPAVRAPGGSSFLLCQSLLRKSFVYDDHAADIVVLEEREARAGLLAEPVRPPRRGPVLHGLHGRDRPLRHDRPIDRHLCHQRGLQDPGRHHRHQRTRRLPHRPPPDRGGAREVRVCCLPRSILTAPSGSTDTSHASARVSSVSGTRGGGMTHRAGRPGRSVFAMSGFLQPLSGPGRADRRLGGDDDVLSRATARVGGGLRVSCPPGGAGAPSGGQGWDPTPRVGLPRVRGRTDPRQPVRPTPRAAARRRGFSGRWRCCC